jgi:hypothetical protein
MGLMEPGCKLEDFGRLAQPAATNRLRCRVNVVSERYLVHPCDKRVAVWSMCGYVLPFCDYCFVAEAVLVDFFVIRFGFKT